MDALRALVPTVAVRLPRLTLGEWPTPLEPLPGVDGVWVKREDLSSPHYGGNKVRCLEPVLGALRAAGRERVFATGAYGSNQALAHVVHGQRHGFTCGALLFPQPPSPSAAANLRALTGLGPALRLPRTLLAFPLEYGSLRAQGVAVVPPGAATPTGALGHLAAALEVALAVEAGAAPAFRHVVLPVGSTCTTAGLMLGFALAAARGLGPPPRLLAVRVTPWPVTAPWRIRRLARRAAALLAALGGPVVEPAPVEVTGAWLGRGYGHATDAGRAAKARFAAAGGPGLDTTYSAKAAACLLAGRFDGPTLFWSTKSRALPPPGDVAGLPPRVQRWLARGDGSEG